MCHLSNVLNVLIQKPYMYCATTYAVIYPWTALARKQHTHAFDFFSTRQISPTRSVFMHHDKFSKGRAFLRISPCTGVLETLLFPHNSAFESTTSVVFCSCDTVGLFHLPRAHVLSGNKALPHFLARYLLVLSLCIGLLPNPKPCWH